MLKKLFFCAMLIVLITTGCAPAPSSDNNASPTNSGGDRGQQHEAITVIARAGIYYNTLTKLAPVFEQESGIKVNIQEVGRDGYLQKISSQLLGGTDGVDVVLILNNFIGQFGAGGQLEPLDDHLKANNSSMDRFFTSSANSVKYADKTYAMPFDVSTMFLFYRKDLISNPPKTWDEYRKLAEKFTKSKNPSSPTDFGIVFQGKHGDTQPKDWYQYFWSMGGKFFDKDMKPTLNSEAGIKSLSFVVDAYNDKLMPPDITTYEFPEVLSVFQNGKVAMAINWNPAYPQLVDPSVSPLVSDKFGIAPLPDGATFAHTWTLTINNASKHKEAAFKFIDWVTGKGAKQYALAGGFPAVKSVMKDSEVVKARPEFPEMVKSLEVAQVEPNLPEWPRIHEFVAEAISTAMAGEKSPADALNKANEKIGQLLKERGYYKKN